MSLEEEEEIIYKKYEENDDDVIFEDSTYFNNSVIINNSIKQEHLYGPLEINSSFSYCIRPMLRRDLVELCNYSGKNCKFKFDINYINQLYVEAIFTRVLKLDLDYITPIIGAMIVSKDKMDYKITHLSIHKNFRNQGLEETLLCCFASIVDTNYEYISIENFATDLIPILKKNKFQEEIIMKQSLQVFNKILESPINID